MNFSVLARIGTMLVALIAAAATLPGNGSAAPARPSLAPVRRWICFYGEKIPPPVWNSLDMAIIDTDGFTPPAQAETSSPLRLGYLSVGEADEQRWFWKEVKGKGFLAEDNPEWKGAHRVDLRSPEWRSLLLERVVPRILASGVQGLFLDTLDTAEYLESKDPARFSGMKRAAIDLVRELRRRYPNLLLLPNNGLPLLNQLGDAVDGAVAEDIYSRFDPKTGKYYETPAGERRPAEAALKAWAKKTRLPVFVILYASPEQKDLISSSSRRARSAGFRPYAATVSLDEVGAVAP